jgi:GNAT superfamily N-acetyltransferase
MSTDIITFYLEMLSPDDFRAGGLRARNWRSPRLRILPPTSTVFSTQPWARRIIGAIACVGRRPIGMRYLDRPVLETWVLSDHGAPVGYCELEAQDAGRVEIAYFGLLPQWVGKGIGAHLLSATIDRAWRFPARRVWVHTCTLDHPHALQNYIDRGFKPFREERTRVTLPRKPDIPSAVGWVTGWV